MYMCCVCAYSFNISINSRWWHRSSSTKGDCELCAFVIDSLLVSVHQPDIDPIEKKKKTRSTTFFFRRYYWNCTYPSSITQLHNQQSPPPPLLVQPYPNPRAHPKSFLASFENFFLLAHNNFHFIDFKIIV